ncbi:MAG TPA: S41 family peptidase [Bacteroidia bacterium]|nr:S41 family peptidase [Bacteroidia bacterium]
MPFLSRFRNLFLTLFLAFILMLGWSFSPDYFEISKNLDIFNAIYRELNMSYVDGTKAGKLMKTGIDAMLASLDPYTVYFTEEDIEEYKYITTGEYGGIGASVSDIDGKMIVDEPREGFAAFRAGIRAGDQIVAINGNNVIGKKSDDISGLLRGNAGTPISIRIIPLGKKEAVELKLQREEIKSPAVPYYNILPDGSTGLIKLVAFTENCSGEVKSALLDLKSRACKQLILDLRGNPGGMLHEAVNIVNLFVEKGQEVVYTRGKVSDWDRSYLAVNNPVDLSIPLLVLVDEHSASASEIVSGALQDLDRAVIMGKRTYGKGLVQQTRDLVYQAKIKITVAKYYIPSGRCVQALDYTHRDAEGRVEKVPDSLVTAFKTHGGRVVYDGAGVTPDLPGILGRSSEICEVLQTKFALFKYASLYFLRHPQLRDSLNFELSDEEFRDFQSYLKQSDFYYESKTEKDLEVLRKNAEELGNFEMMRSEYDLMREKIKMTKNQDMMMNEKQIRNLLSEEIISRYYFQKGRLRYALKHDETLAEAAKLAANENELKSVLSRQDKATKAFNPMKKF